jgi:hypothetical protein
MRTGRRNSCERLGHGDQLERQFEEDRRAAQLAIIRQQISPATASPVSVRFLLANSLSTRVLTRCMFDLYAILTSPSKIKCILDVGFNKLSDVPVKSPSCIQFRHQTHAATIVDPPSRSLRMPQGTRRGNHHDCPGCFPCFSVAGIPLLCTHQARVVLIEHRTTALKP